MKKPEQLHDPSVGSRDQQSSTEAQTSWLRYLLRPSYLQRCLLLVWISTPWACFAQENAPEEAPEKDRVERVEVAFDPLGVNQTTIRRLNENEFELTTTGNDSYFELAIDGDVDRSQLAMLGLEYFSPQGVSGMELRLRTLRGAWSPVIDAGSLTPAEGWTAAGIPLSEEGNLFWQTERVQRLRIDFGQQAGVVVKLRGLHLRGLNRAETVAKRDRVEIRKNKLQLADNIDAYLNANDPTATPVNRIDRITVLPTEIIVEGNCDTSKGKLYLSRLGMHQLSAVAGSRSELIEINDKHLQAKDRFRIVVPRIPLSKRDIAMGRWQIVSGGSEEEIYQPVSNAMYAPPDMSEQVEDLPPPPLLENAKGLGGISPVFGLDELLELGVKHITINVVITDLLYDNDQPGTTKYLFEGRSWWLNEPRLQHVDETVKFASQHGITSALIVLIPRGSHDIIVHPEATGSGIYAMPNFTSQAATEKYEAVIGILAKRYSGGDHGRVDHWIMHNEVDFGWIWTNMGEQPMPVYMDSYVRSMRIAYQQSRRFNPYSTVFISLTHHWNVGQDAQWRTYSPRAMLQMLSKLSRVEGDFHWGIAYHPYPENLFNPKTWEDRQAVNNVDTQRITMKNIDVLTHFLDQPAMRDELGQVRPLLFSEQGYHTAGYGEEAQRLQGAALLYTWDRMRSIQGVLAYDYHRWVDAAEEGGLLLGLRTVPTAERRAGEKKLGWEVFRSIDTERESRWRTELESLYANPAKQD